MCNFDDEHLEVFKNYVRDPGNLDTMGARVPDNHVREASEGRPLFKGMSDDWKVRLSSLPKEKLDKAAIFGMVKDPDCETLPLCVMILAWGGIRKNNLKHLLTMKSEAWLEVAEEIRAGSLTRSEAYERFSSLRRENNLKGMGPSFFTKLIFFLMKGAAVSKPGYIMDQWVGSAVNLLVDDEIVLMDGRWNWSETDGSRQIERTFDVSDLNTSKTYGSYCLAIEKLAGTIKKQPDEVERLLMSGGGHRPLPWRRHVIESRVPPR